MTESKLFDELIEVGLLNVVDTFEYTQSAKWLREVKAEFERLQESNKGWQEHSAELTIENKRLQVIEKNIPECLFNNSVSQKCKECLWKLPCFANTPIIILDGFQGVPV